MVKYKVLLRKYLNSVVVHTKEKAFLVDSEKENIYGIKKRRDSIMTRNIREASWRAACDEWISNFVEDCKGASTPIYQLYNSYIENNPNNYMDIGQFGKVLRSWFPYRKRRRGKQGAQIYVYQDVALKSRMIPRPRHIRDIPQDPPDPPLSSCIDYSEDGPAKSCTFLNPSQCDSLTVPSMMVGNHKIGPILVSIPDGACTAPSTTKGPKDRPECMVPLPTSEPKRKYEDERSSKSPLTHKKKKISDGGKYQSSSHSRDDSALLLEDEIKDEIEVEEESCLPLDQCLSKVPSHPLLSVKKQDESGTVPPPSELVAVKHSKPKYTKPLTQTSDKHRMSLARQWVDANLTERKGATTSANAVFEAYAHDHPDEALPQSSLTVVIRGKFPTRRKRFEQDPKFGYYYQDLELVKHGDTPTMFPWSLETTCRSPVKIQVSTDQPMLNNKENNKTEILSSKMKNIMTQEEGGPDITTESEKMEHIMVRRKKQAQATVVHKSKRVNSSNFTLEKWGRKLLTLARKEEKPTTTEGKKEERQAIETQRAKMNPVIFTDKERGIPVAVANPPSESVFSYHGVPCVMIPLGHTPNVNSHVQDPTLLATSKGGTVVSPLAKTVSSVSQQVITQLDEAKKQSQNIPSRSETTKNVSRVAHVTSLKSNNLGNNMTDSTHPFYPVFQGKIQIKTVASINATDLSSFVDKEKMDSSTGIEGTEKSALSSSSTQKEEQYVANLEEKEKLAVPISFLNTSLEIKKEPVDENNGINCQSLIDKAHVTSPSSEHLSDMDVLDYIKSEMAEDDEYVSVNVRMKPSQDIITKSLDIPGDALKITQNKDVFMCESQLTDHDRNIVTEKVSEHITGVTKCLSNIVRQSDKVENIVHVHDDNVQENAKNLIMTENRTEGAINDVQSQIIQCKSSSSNVAEHESVIVPVNVENEVTENKNQNAREGASKLAEMYKESSQLEGRVESVRPDGSISKVGEKITSFRKGRSWDEDIRSFVVDSDSISRVEGSKRPKKRKKKKRKDRNLNETGKECSVKQVNSSRKNPRHSKLTKNTQNERTESFSENAETRLPPVVHEEGIPLSDRTFDKNNEHFKENNKLTGERVKRAVLNAAFELLSSASSMLTENEKAQKLESALFDENPAVHYDLTRDRTYANITNDSPDFPCIPSSTLEDLKLCSQDHCTELLLHHQACPQLGCQKCSILRAAYVHITLFQHQCQVWRTFTKIVSRHSRACRSVRCSVLFCQYMKHELHLSGVSVLSNHLLDDHTHLEAEFTKCHRVGPHGAALHCSHQQDVSLPLPWVAQVRCQQQAPSVEARGLKVMTDLLMPDRHRSQDVTTPILHTLQFAAAHCDNQTQTKSKD